jgi:hypothetical protein
MEKRRDKWIGEIASRLGALEEKQAINLARLASADGFVSVLARSTQAGLTTADPAKIRLLVAAVENTPLGQMSRKICECFSYAISTNSP